MEHIADSSVELKGILMYQYNFHVGHPLSEIEYLNC